MVRCHDPGEALPGEIVERRCAAHQRCDCGMGLLECRDDVGDAVDAAFAEAAEAGLSVDADCIRARLEAFDAITCRTLHDLDIDERATLWNDQLGCSPFIGDGSAGDSCTALELSDGSDCARELTCRDGACQPISTWPAHGDDCDDPLLDCIGDAVCATDPTDGVLRCLPRAGDAESCVGTEAVCEPGLTCDDAICAGAPGPTEPCSDAVASSNRCALGLYCDEGVCRPRSLEGDACSSISCATQTTCDDTRGICVRLAPMACTLSVP